MTIRSIVASLAVSASICGPAAATLGAAPAAPAAAPVSLASPAPLLGHASPSAGYWLLAGDGGVFAFGAGHYGSAASDPAKCPPNVVDRALPNGTCFAMAATPDGRGYWILNGDTGAIYPFGDAHLHGQVRAAFVGLPRDLVPTGKAIVSTPSGNGYWVLEAGVGNIGSIYHFGDAGYFGDTHSIAANTGQVYAAPPVALATTPDGKGYWEVHSDGGVFAFGDARYYGSMGGHHLNRPIVAMTTTSDGKGYWLVASDGGVFAFGDAYYRGSTGGMHLNQPIVGMARNPNAPGYWLAAADGGIFTFGGAPFLGSTGAIRLNRPVFAIATANGPQGTLHGTVVDPQGDPVAGVAVVDRSRSFVDADDGVSRTNQRGQFHVVCAPNPHPRVVLDDDPIMINSWEPAFGNSYPGGVDVGDPAPVDPSLGWTYASSAGDYTGPYNQAPYCSELRDPIRIVLPDAGKVAITLEDAGGNVMPSTAVSVWVPGLDNVDLLTILHHPEGPAYGVETVFDEMSDEASIYDSLRYWTATTDATGRATLASLSATANGYSVWVGNLLTTCSLVNVTAGSTTTVTCKVIPAGP